MHFKKIFIFIALCLIIGFLGCSKEAKKVEGPKQERITKNLVPPKSELKGQNFLVELSDLQVVTVVDAASKEIIETPTLKGNIKITNKSKDMLDIQVVTLESMDEAGKPIPYKSEEKIEKVRPFWKALQPESITEGSLDVTIPTKAIKENSLRKIEVDLVYVPSPLKREILTLSEKVE
jgi:activator of HSP90 ATPase